MSDSKRKYIDIDDFGNIENIIKSQDPAFNDIVSRLPGNISNYAQQQLSMGIRKDRKVTLDENGLKPYQAFLKRKGEANA